MADENQSILGKRNQREESKVIALAKFDQSVQSALG